MLIESGHFQITPNLIRKAGVNQCQAVTQITLEFIKTSGVTPRVNCWLIPVEIQIGPPELFHGCSCRLATGWVVFRFRWTGFSTIGYEQTLIADDIAFQFQR